MKQLHPDLLKQFYTRYPNTQGLKIVPARHEHGYHALLDIDDVQGLLGAVRFSKLMQGVKTVYSCGHRMRPPNDPDTTLAGAEVHCIHAEDVEKFLAGGN